MRRADPVDLLILSPHIAPPGGGVQRLAADIKAAFADRHVRLVGVSSAVSSDPDTRTVLERGGRFGHVLTTVAFLVACVAELRRRPRFVHAMTWRAALPLLVVARRTPAALYCHGAELVRTSGGKPAAALRRRVLRRVPLIVANSHFTADLVRAAVGRKPPVIHPPLGALPVATADKQVHAGFRILSVGRLVANKGHDRLIRVAAELRARGFDVRLRIVGTGPDESALRALIGRLGMTDAVELLGGVDDAELAAEYRNADVFALLSTPVGHEVEGFGIVFLEAAAYGLPSIAGRSGGAQEAVVDGVTGFVVDDDDAAVSALASLASDSDLRQRLGDAGSARVEEFRLPRFRERLATAYAAVVDSF